MKKQLVAENSDVCEVTFELPADVNAQTACVVGEFNDWDPEAHPMTRGEDGSFAVIVSLKPGQAYCYRYLLDDGRWENDFAADAYVPNPYGSDDSVVQL